jgi:hypothetical protein
MGPATPPLLPHQQHTANRQRGGGYEEYAGYEKYSERCALSKGDDLSQEGQAVEWLRSTGYEGTGYEEYADVERLTASQVPMYICNIYIGAYVYM